MTLPFFTSFVEFMATGATGFLATHFIGVLALPNNRDLQIALGCCGLLIGCLLYLAFTL